MKNQSFARRLGFALAGLRTAWRTEKSFKVHVVAAVAAAAALLVLRPAPFWWAAVALVIGVVMAAELFNTALEHLADRLHPEQHPHIKIVKDCAAAAVLVASLAALGVAAALAVEAFVGR
jgi:diacylglycerol kinase (ATP)